MADILEKSKEPVKVTNTFGRYRTPVILNWLRAVFQG